MSFMKRLLDAFDPQKFSNALVASQASVQVNEWLEALGPERVEMAVTSSLPVYKLMTPEQIKVLRANILEHKALILLVLDKHLDFILDNMPAWAQEIRQKHGKQGDDWLLQQMEWLEGIASGQPKMVIKARWDKPPGP
jgi:hypothetical protein